jgi:phage protein D
VGETKRIVCGENVTARDEAEGMARAVLNRAATQFITGEGRCIGHPDIKAGRVVELQGLGERFRGLYYVVSCTHSLGQGGYHTFFTVRRSAT